MAAAPIFRAAIFAFVVALFVGGTAGPAAADEAAAVNKVTNLNRRALEAYGKQDYETAKALLKEALELCASAGLDKHAIRARTHIHFGVVAIVGFQQREVGLKQFRKALEVQPDIKLTKQLVTPELQDAFEEAVLAGEGGGGGREPGGGPVAGGGDEGGGGQAADGEDDEGGARRKPVVRKPPPRKKPGGDDDDDEGEGQKGLFFFALTGGVGVGLVKGEGELDPAAHKLDAMGFAFGQGVQATPEVGLFVMKNLLLSLQLRAQYVSGVNGKEPRIPNTCGPDNFCTPGNGARAIFGKVTYLIGDGPLHFTVGAQAGYGNIRHGLEFPNDGTCKSAPGGASQTCVDTLASGPAFFGPTAGMIYEIGDTLDFILGVNTALGVPKFTYNFDLSLGLGFRI
jgi:hypothetical protein